MAKGQNVNVLLASPDALAHMPPETATNLAAQLAAYGIAVTTVDSNIDPGVQVDNVPINRRIVGYLGQSDKDINGLVAATKRGGLALVVDGPASIWCVTAEGRCFPFG